MDYTIIMPSKPKIIHEDANKGVYEIEGLHAGYGYTLGNSLRRIIMASLPGSAITMVKIEGAPHEFSTIAGVKEDVITILLNLKKVRFKMHTDEEQTAKISVCGDKTVTAEDIKAPSQLEVLNKEQRIATLSGKDAKLEMELTVEKGLGYMPREMLHKSKTDIGTIILDAVFTPIRKVNYEVENMRVGERTDYNRLRFFIETDGTIAPREALEKAIEIMLNHLSAIVGFKKEKEEIPVSDEVAVEGRKTEKEESLEDKDTLKMRIDDLQFSSRTLNSLSSAGIRTVSGLARKKESDLLEIEGIGKKAVQEIKRALGNYGMILK